MLKNSNSIQLDTNLATTIYTQDYGPRKTIEGIKILNLKHFVGDDGDFAEVMRFDEKGCVEGVKGFHIRQINRSSLFPHAVKAWHVHLRQNEMWFVSPRQQLLMGLWDIREDSSTKGVAMRINLGGGRDTAVYIPRGVAHGAANFSLETVELWYFADNQFDAQDPDEHRVPWDANGADFWQPERD